MEVVSFPHSYGRLCLLFPGALCRFDMPIASSMRSLVLLISLPKSLYRAHH